MLRLRVVEYFEDVRNALDLHTETKISEDVAFESYWNERRGKQLSAVNKIEQASLARADKVLSTCTDSIEEKEKLPLSQVMTDFCFPLEYGGMMFVATVDKYIDENEVDMFRQFLKIQYKDTLANCNRKKCGLTKFKSEVFDQLRKILTIDETVVDMSWWFHLDYHFDEVELAGAQFNRGFGARAYPWRIRRLAASIDIGGSSIMKEFVSDKLKAIQDKFRQAESIVVTLSFIISSDKSRAGKEIIASELASIEWDQRTTPIVEFNVTKNLRQQWYEESTKAVGWYKQLWISLDDVDWFSKVNWGLMFELSVNLTGFNEQSLSKLDLSSLCALKSFKLYDNNRRPIKDIQDWSFLDPIRAGLEVLSIKIRSLEHISWRTFHGMVKLERLSYSCYGVRDVEVDDRGHLFADLVRLKSLKIVAHRSLMSTKWFCELPSLEILDIQIPADSTNTQAQIHFKLPNLKSLVFNADLIVRYSLDLARSFSTLSHVDQLTVPMYILQNGWFKGFNCTSLKIYFDKSSHPILPTHAAYFRWIRNPTEQPNEWNTFGELASVTTIRLEGVPDDPSWLEANKYKFNGLSALQNIHLIPRLDSSTDFKMTKSLVYFEHLSKFVMVQFYQKNNK